MPDYSDGTEPAKDPLFVARSTQSTSERTSQGTSPSAELDRKRSVTFSGQVLQQSKRRSVYSGMSAASPALSPRAGDTDEVRRVAAESSADEETSFFRRDGSSGRAYGAVADQGNSTAQNESQDVRRRTGQTKSKAQRSGQTSSRGDTDDEAHESWWRKAVDKYGSIELENKGSVARDHLALGREDHAMLRSMLTYLERTFLAWLRTSLSFASIGIAVTQLFRLNTSLSEDNQDQAGPDPAASLKQVGKPLGATFLGICMSFISTGA